MRHAGPGGVMKRGAGPVTLKASAAETASTTHPWLDVSEAAGVYVKVDVTAASGTTPTMTVLVEGTHDGGTTVFELGTLGANGYRVGPVGTAPSNLTGAATVHSFFAAPMMVRSRSVIGGTTPSFTYSVVVEPTS